MKKLNASKLRGNIYKILDEIISSGEPVIITRKGETLKIVPDRVKPKLGTKKCNWINGNLDNLISIDWSKEWNETK